MPPNRRVYTTMREERYRTYDNAVTLISEDGYTYDDMRNRIAGETRQDVLCREESASRSEFYNAAANGHRPAFVLAMHAFEYSGQRLCEYKGARYRVIRTYVDGEEIELTCEDAAGVVKEGGP